MSLLTWFKRLHKWLAIIVGIQLLLWIISGLVFSFINHKEVGGNFIYKNHQQDQVINFEDFDQILTQYPNASQISLITVLEKAAFKIKSDKNTLLVDARSKKVIQIDEELVKQIAAQNYHGKGKLLAVNFIDMRNDENRGMSLPAWQLVYEDDYGSHLYLSAKTGEYQGIRTDSWRIFDFFMMLHFMDFAERGNFNNGLIIFFALVLLFFSMSGMLLVYSSFSRQDFTQLIHLFLDNKTLKIRVNDSSGNSKVIKVAKDIKLIDALADNGLELESVCGGGGICGACRVKLVNATSTLSENLTVHETLTQQELSEGYRLACQFSVAQALEIKCEGSSFSSVTR